MRNRVYKNFKKTYPDWDYSLKNKIFIDAKGAVHKEKWKWVKGYKYLYQISSFGRLKSFFYYKKGKIKTPSIINEGYLSYKLTKNKLEKSITAHRLVAMHFIKNAQKKPQINHKDFNIANNSVWNLEWVTQSENQKHSFLEGYKNHIGVRNPRCILTEKDVLKIRSGVYDNLSAREIGEIYGCSGSGIRSILIRNTWKHI